MATWVKTLSWFNKQNNFASASYFFVNFFAVFLRDYDVKLPKFAFYSMENENKQPQNFISFSELGYIVPWNSTSGGFAYIWQSKWLGMIAIKTERTQIHFLIKA